MPHPCARRGHASGAAVTKVDHGVRVDRDGLVLSDLQIATTLDVLFDGHRVWSVDPQRDGEIVDGQRRVVWPASVHRFLDGVSHVQVHEHIGDRRYFDAQLSFGSGRGRVRFADAAGNPLALGKFGALVRSFAAHTDRARSDFVGQVRRVLDLLNTSGGVRAYVCYGLLLGAVREGRMIGHDTDGDVGYLSSATNPVDVILESYRLERLFQHHGWKTQRMPAGYFQVFVPAFDGGRIGIDVFISFYAGDTFFLTPFVGGAFPRSKLLPLGEIELEGRPLPAPADPEALLELTYGPTWRIPDPAFKYQTPGVATRRLGMRLGGDVFYREWWSAFFGRRAGDDAARRPSECARWMARQLPRGRYILDVGCGLGRDTIWLSRQGHTVTGLDFAPNALARAGRRARAAGVDPTFRPLNLYDTRETLTTAARLVRDNPRPDAVHARWLLDSLNEDGRRLFLTFAGMVLGGVRGRLYTEVRLVQRPRALPRQAFPGQWQAQLSVDQLRDEIAERGGTIEFLERSDATGSANEHVPPRCRLVVRWS